jgi:flagellar motor switch protein FliG
MTGLEKAALVIMQMSPGQAAEVMRQFSEAEAEEIAAGIMRMRKVDAVQADAAITEFHAKTQSRHTDARGGRDAAVHLLEASFGEERAAGLIDRATSTVGGRSFEFLDLVDTATRVDIAQALATMGAATQPVIEVVAESLKIRVRSALAPSTATEVVGGVQPLVDIMQRADIATEHELLEELGRRDPGLAEDVRSRMLSFDDLVKLESRDVQQVIRGIDAAQLAIALKGADEAIITLVRENMSERNRELVDDEISLLGKVRKQQVMEARAELVKVMRELEASGSLILATASDGEDEEDDLV